MSIRTDVVLIGGPASIALHEAELLDEISHPHHPAIGTVQTEEETADALQVDESGFLVTSQVCPTYAGPGDSCLVDVESVLPKSFTGVGVEAGQHLLSLNALAGTTIGADASS